MGPLQAECYDSLVDELKTTRFRLHDSCLAVACEDKTRCSQSTTALKCFAMIGSLDKLKDSLACYTTVRA